MACKHKLVADVTVLGGGATALVRYADPTRYDGETGWFVPDDFLERLEHPDDAARRIARDQLGLRVAEVSLSHVESFEGNGFWHLIFHYGVALPARALLERGGNVADARWFPLDQLPEASAVAHDGWALETIPAVARRLEL